MADDPYADYRRLNDPAARAAIEGDRIFIAEGPTAIVRLIESGHRVRSVLVTPTAHDRLIADASAALERVDAPIHVVSRRQLHEIVGFDLHRGAVAAAERRPLPDVTEILTTATSIGVLEGLNDPENLGAIARSARALDIDALILDPRCIDPYYRRTVRVSMGAVLTLPVARAEDWPGVIDTIHQHGFETWAMTPAADAVSLWDPALRTPERLAMLFGAEGPGLEPDTIARCQRRVRIPIAEAVDSLNVGASAAVAFAERTRRLSAGLTSG
jgi:tRNA G18 (ribose-2'-O)-methylase SpoU